MPIRFNLVGQKFAELTVLQRVENDKYGMICWLCLCSCGRYKTLNTSKLRSGQKSCGCLSSKVTTKRNTTHGLSSHALYTTWTDMKTRCYNKKFIGFKYYGGRGIQVCERWRNSFKNFYLDVIDLYIPNLEIDRIDVNKNYEPGNVRWVDTSTQVKNRRDDSDVMLHAIFNKLTVLELAGYAPNGRRIWLCQCECGMQLKVSGTDLRLKLRTACKLCKGFERSKLDKKTILSIRESHDRGWTYKANAAFHNTSLSTVARIVKRQVFKLL